MAEPTDPTDSSDSGESEPLTVDELAWPQAERRVAVGKVLEIGGGLRLGVVRVDDRTATVQVWPIADQPRAEMLRLRPGERRAVLGRHVRLLETGHDGRRGWLRVTAS
jgi:hypothetical protein